MDYLSRIERLEASMGLSEKEYTLVLDDGTRVNLNAQGSPKTHADAVKLKEPHFAFMNEPDYVPLVSTKPAEPGMPEKPRRIHAESDIRTDQADNVVDEKEAMPKARKPATMQEMGEMIARDFPERFEGFY